MISTNHPLSGRITKRSMKQRIYNHHIEIFSGALWPQRHAWRRVVHLLPTNACLLAIDTRNEKQTQVLRQVTRSFRDKGRQVLIWLAPTISEHFRHWPKPGQRSENTSRREREMAVGSSKPLGLDNPLFPY